MYLNGLSLRQIANEVGLSHVTIRKILTHELEKYDKSLFLKVSDTLKNSGSKSIKNPEVLKRVLRAYYSLINDNKTYLQIANDEHVSKFVIQRDLTDRLVKLNKIAPEIITYQMLKKANEVLNLHSLNNLK